MGRLGEALLVLARHAPAAPPLACPAYWGISLVTSCYVRGAALTRHEARPRPRHQQPRPQPRLGPRPRQLLLPRPGVPGLGRGGGGDGVAGPRPAVTHLAWQQQGALVLVGGDILVLG